MLIAATRADGLVYLIYLYAYIFISMFYTRLLTEGVFQKHITYFQATSFELLVW